MSNSTITLYRLRWSRNGGHRTRYYTRGVWAARAAERYRSQGFEVALDEQTLRPLTPWEASDGSTDPLSQVRPVGRYECAVVSSVRNLMGPATEFVTIYSCPAVEADIEVQEIGPERAVGTVRRVDLVMHGDWAEVT